MVAEYDFTMVIRIDPRQRGLGEKNFPTDGGEWGGQRVVGRERVGGADQDRAGHRRGGLHRQPRRAAAARRGLPRRRRRQPRELLRARRPPRRRARRGTRAEPLLPQGNAAASTATGPTPSPPLDTLRLLSSSPVDWVVLSARIDLISCLTCRPRPLRFSR